jgi:hypothetical protein
VVAGLATAGWQVVGSPIAHRSPAASPSSTTVAASGDVLAATDSVAAILPAAAPDSVLLGRASGVRLLSYGFVPGYGSGSNARSAPAGMRLLAFRTEATAGETGAAPPVLSIRIGGNVRGPLVVTSSYLVAAVPQDSTAVDLILTDTGVTQALSLLTGRPSSANPAVCLRVHRLAALEASRPVTVQVKATSGTVGITSGTLTVRSVALSYWADDGSHASSSAAALLHIDATVTLDGDPKAYGADAALLSVLLPAATAMRLPAHNAAANPATQIDDVVEVPADLTTGTISYSGSMTTSTGMVTVQTPVLVPFSIPAG